MSSTPTSQLTLSLFDSTALSGGLTLDGPISGLRYREPEFEDEAPAAPEPARVPARNWRLVGDRALARGWKARAADNLAAIQLAQEITRDDRNATAEEQEVLSRFVGYGASELANTLFRRPGEAFRSGWEDLGASLEQTVTQEQLAGLARATQYAHYTPEFIVRAIWRGLTRMGFDGGSVLEPGCGTGLFLAAMPDALAGKVSLTAVEMDPCTAQIATLLHPDAWVRCEDFTKAKLAETYELVIGNPPFSDRTVRASDPAGKLGLSLHDYFIARSIERLKPGGLAAFVTSRYTMDKTDRTAREHIASMADLVGAVRLPQASMLAASGTEVVVDVLFFQRRMPGVAASGTEWDSLVEVVPEEDGQPALRVNRYFGANPHMVLGQHSRTSGPFGPTYTCRGESGDALTRLLDTRIGGLQAGVHTPPDTPVMPRSAASRLLVGTAAEGATVKEGSFLILDGHLVQVVDGVPVPVAVRAGKDGDGIPAKHARILRALIPVRDWVRAVLRAQEANEPWGSAQIRLRVAYNTFKRNFGPINLTSISTSTDAKTGEERETVRRPNLQPFLDDPDCWLVSSVEHYDEDTGTAKPGPLFNERVIHPPAAPLVVTAADALAVTLHEVGHVDLDRIAELLGRTREEVTAELGEAVFLNPALSFGTTETWLTADAYLSGPVRTKLAVAEAAAGTDPRFERNVEALRRVQPEDLRPSDITARLGGPWLPTAAIEAFSAEVIGVATRVRHTVEIAAWSLDVSRFEYAAAATSEWGTARRHAGLLLSDALNSSIPQIYDTKFVDGREVRELNEKETEAAKEKLGRIKEAFERWVWTDADRTDRLARIYNDKFNNLVPRTFDGSHLQLPGASSAIRFRPHQKRGVWRIVSAGGTYLAHAVGAGKTFLMAAAIMEQKRLGLVSKAIVANLIQSELCRAMVNAASGQANLVPVPAPIQVTDAFGGGSVTWSYSLSPGNETASPACGTITLRNPKQGSNNIAGVSVDMTAVQRSILTNVLNADIRPTVQTVAQRFWQTKKVAELTPLLGVLTAATNTYTERLTAAATSKTNELRVALQDAGKARNGNVGLIQNQAQLASLGWTSAGAYYLEFARLNGQTMSLVSATPTVGTPSYEGLGRSLSRDLAPLMTSATAFMTKLRTYVTTTDGLDVPGGNADLFQGATPGEDGSSAMEQLFRSLRLNDRLLNLFVDGMSPTGSMWADPFSALMQLGHKLSAVALTALGLAGLLNSTAGTAATAVWSALSANPVAAGSALVGHFVVSFLATPIFAGLMAILVPGLLIAFVLPMIPWLMFLAGVIGWLVLVCEAVIAVPLWMLAHLTFNGDGVHGRAQEGYSLLFNVIARPTLMIIGLFLGYHIFAASSWLIRQSFGIAAGFVLANGWLVTNVIGVAVLLCIFVLVHIVVALLSFRMITLIPHHLPKLIGFTSANRVDMEQFGRDAAIVGTARALGNIRRGLETASAGSGGQGNALGYGGQRSLPAPGRGEQPGTRAAGADTTLRAATDVPPSRQPREEA